MADKYSINQLMNAANVTQDMVNVTARMKKLSPDIALAVGSVKPYYTTDYETAGIAADIAKLHAKLLMLKQRINRDIERLAREND